MDAVHGLVIFAILSRCVAADVSQILARIPRRTAAEEEILERFVTSLTDSYDLGHSDIVLLIQNENFDISEFWKFCSAKIPYFGRSLKIQFVKRIKEISRILEVSFWTRKTLFVLVLERSENDTFFADMAYQALDVHVMKARDIDRDFGGLVVRNELGYARTMKIVFRKFWDARVTNVIALAPRKSNVYMYTYFPYTELNCPDTLVPVLTNVWFSDTGRFHLRHRLFPDKMKNMHRCMINVTLINSPPGVMAEKGTVDGIEGELLKDIFRSLNATPRFYFVNAQDVSMNDSESSLNFLLENVNRGESELGAGFLIPTVSYSQRMDQIHFGLGLCLTWAVPRVDMFPGFIGPITDTFTPALWNTIFVVAVVSSLVIWRLLRPKKLVSSVFCILSISLGKSVVLPRKRLPKIFLLTFIWYSTILGWTFLAGLGSDNIISRPPRQYESTRRIIESGFEIMGVESAVQLFKENIKFTRRNGQAVPVKAMDMYNALLKVAYQKRAAYMGLKLSLSYYIQFLKPELLEHVYVHKTCLLNFQPFFALRKNSPLSVRVRELTFSLVESGAKNKLEEKYLKRAMKPWRPSMSKGDSLARGSLMIMWTGMVFSIFVFIGECVFHLLMRALRLQRRMMQNFKSLSLNTAQAGAPSHVQEKI